MAADGHAVDVDFEGAAGNGLEGISADISDITAGTRRGFGSVRVAVTIGASTWRTSIFPDSKTGTYLLPVKKAVRAAERLEPGDSVRARVETVDHERERGRL